MPTEKIRKAAVLFIGSVILCAAVVLIYLFVPEHPEEILGLGIGASVLAFTVMPAYAVAWTKFKDAGFYANFRLGYVFGLGFFLLSLIFAPFFAVWFYVDSFRN